MTYSHRNGETEPPTIEGSYGMRVPSDDRVEAYGIIIYVVIVKGVAMRLLDDSYSKLPKWKYWGPITGPWNE